MKAILLLSPGRLANAGRFGNSGGNVKLLDAKMANSPGKSKLNAMMIMKPEGRANNHDNSRIFSNIGDIL
jgi:hypothetical protein